MCGILVHRGKGDNSRVALRGRDGVSEMQAGGYTFCHSLLSVTGNLTRQPFVDRDIVCIYNGEIYNYPFKESDGEVLIPLYREYGPEFVRLLDGEFAIALYDFEKNLTVFATDPFGTKPLFVNGLECASYRSGVGGERLPANTLCVIAGGKTREVPVHFWDFEFQRKDAYDDWITAFQEAIRKRAVPGCFLGLSSGYDSGAIACELLRQGVDFKAYVYRGQENPDVLQKRVQRVPNAEWFEPDPETKCHLIAHADNERYTIHYDGKQTDMKMLDDGGVFGVATICKLARAEGRRVALSGQGGDEILSDYALFPSQSELRGCFPEQLTEWRNFGHGCQESYLIKEEYAAGAYGIETRYPFLDRAVVQEFLWLTAEAKNRHYKAPLHEYLLCHDFPFDEGKKIGFSVYI